MKPLFTVHEGEFLVGDHINRKLGHKYDVWVPTKDSGVDLLVTRKRPQGKAVGLQVKFSRGDYDPPVELTQRIVATSFFTLNPVKIRQSRAELWVFVILTLRHKKHYVLVPTQELRERIPNGCEKSWILYLWIFNDRSCYQVRGLGREKSLEIIHSGVQEPRRDYSAWLENWNLLDTLTKIVG